MHYALIGHRGTGKTSLLKRLQTYYGAQGGRVECIDLDKEIEVRSGHSIDSIFALEGEEAFRQIERSTFRDIDLETIPKKHDIYLALGAGFDPSLIPSHWHVIWIRRPSDEKGRIFLDRPRLNPSVPSLSEFQERYHRRQIAYRARADETLWLDEGLEAPDLAERDYFFDGLRNLDGAITILPEQFRSHEQFELWVRSRVSWGVRWFELRDDLLNEEQMDLAVRLLPDERILVSYRDPARVTSTSRIVGRQGLAFDWPLEMGDCTVGEPRFLSSHERREGESIADALARMPLEIPAGTQLKAALPIHNFDELNFAHQWREKAPDVRVFLPLSQDGRWNWYRLRLGSASSLNFFREGDGTGADQPTLLQWARMRILEEERKIEHLQPRFAAVLGDPVAHSRTPIEQHDHFARAHSSVFAIRVTPEEWQAGALRVLHRLGLRWAAVTAPLKELAYEACGERLPACESLRSVNTMQWMDDLSVWRGANTDAEGFSRLVEGLAKEYDFERVAVWGGGGTLNVVKAVLPKAEHFSLRTVENRDPSRISAKEFHPEIVVWAVNRSRADVNEPPLHWRPQLIIDLNYADDSPGRTYALQTGARYISGVTMFKAQAVAQRRFWEL